MRLPVYACVLLAMLAVPAFAQGPFDTNGRYDAAADMRGDAEQIFAMANRARRIAGAPPLQWDPALAQAALQHCRRMVEEGEIAHRYGGEPDLTERAANAGARFGVIEENIAIGPSAAGIHEEWMNSPGHRSNLLSPDVNGMGVAVLSARGVLYAVADYAQEVPALSAAQVEARVANLVRVSGITIGGNTAYARAACAMNSGLPSGVAGQQPRFIMRWQDPDLNTLPKDLADRLSTGNYRMATIGSCPAQTGAGGFSAYRVAVLLF